MFFFVHPVSFFQRPARIGLYQCPYRTGLPIFYSLWPQKKTLRRTKPHCHLVLMPIFGESRFSGEVTCWLLIVGRPPCYHFQRRVGGGGCEVLQGILYQTFMDALITE